MIGRLKLLNKINRYKNYKGDIDVHDLEKQIDNSLTKEENDFLKDKIINEFYEEEKKKVLENFILSKNIAKLKQGLENQEKQNLIDNRRNQQIIQNFQNELKLKCQNLAKQYEEKNMKLKELNDKEISNLENQINSIKNEVEKNKAIENKNFREQIESKINDEIEKIIKEYESNESNFISKEISKIFLSDLDKLVIEMIKNEKISLHTLNYLENLIVILKNNIKEVNLLNILLLGMSGVGKSTLINKIKI